MFYSLDEIDKYENIQYYMIYGSRSGGKSYAVQKRMLDNFFQNGEEFIICKRYEEDIKTKVCSTMLEHLYDYVLETYNHKIKYYHGKWLAYEDGLEGKLCDCKIIGYSASISTSDRIKGSQYPRVTTILFEEFMSMSASYLYDEVNLLLNIVSTVARLRTNIKVFMLGNAISKHSPYASALGVKLHRIQPGDIILKQFSDKKGRSTRFIIQRTNNVDVYDKDNNEGVVYNVFGNSGVGSMITSGDFETHKYNRVVSGVTFEECIKNLPKGKYKLFNKHDRLPIGIKYEDIMYLFYMKQTEEGTVIGFREFNENKIHKTKIEYLINNRKRYKNITNIVDLSRFHARNILIDNLLNEIVSCHIQDRLVFIDDDNGEDVINAFKLSGV